MKKHLFTVLLAICLIVLTACGNQSVSYREQISLSGQWELKLDNADAAFVDSVYLPGTTDTNKKGIYQPQGEETTHLTRAYTYVGKAWYKKQVEIPQNWQGKHISLYLERTKPTQVWIDGEPVGSSDDISTAQTYCLTDYLTPGKHEILIMVDNGKSVPEQLLSNSHAYTESTQTNWNGIIGQMYLEAREALHIKQVQVYPDADNRTVRVKFSLNQPELLPEGAQVKMQAVAWNTKKKHRADARMYDLSSSVSEYSFDYPLGEDALLWSEFDPALYQLQLTVDGFDSQVLSFGLRDFSTKGTQFAINGRTIFLRGKHDACVFPITAHTPMDVESWQHYFRVCKEYGINHCRFHSWCPPRACFEAADIEGIYLQPELPFWGSLKREESYLCDFLLKEGLNIQNEYGNHASFVMFALGNELSGDQDVMKEFINAFRHIDSRHLYAYGSNNFLGFSGQVPGEDFLVTCRIGGADDYSTHTRGSFSFADAHEGGYLNNTYPNSVMDFAQVIEGCTVPVISHETGQFQVYPNYNEIEKYTGVLRPDNIEIFRSRLEKSGMAGQAKDFFQASGRWSALLYKADIEMDLRTKGFGGFQLLDLQDYPGQGSAYVGILDAFMDNKGVISAEEWREFCNDVVPLFVTEKFCWTTHETLTGDVKIANYSEHNLAGKTLKWELSNKENNSVSQGELPINATENGLLDVGSITPHIAGIATAQELTLTLQVVGTLYKNRYSLWIYPAETEVKPTPDVLVANRLTKEVTASLQEGANVLYFPAKEELKKVTIEPLFQTDYWNYRMFKGICEWLGKTVSPGTLGILTNPEHPVFGEFPTDYHTNWQWYPIIKQSYPLILDRLPAEYTPIVQVIDNVERNHKLGLIFEFSIGKGKLLVCMANLEAAMDKPEAKQLYKSMLTYMGSEAFNPQHRLSVEELKDLFSTEVGGGEIKGVRNISYE